MLPDQRRPWWIHGRCDEKFNAANHSSDIEPPSSVLLDQRNAAVRDTFLVLVWRGQNVQALIAGVA
jgi:hypothetical protein